jgi:hypothetical protein
LFYNLLGTRANEKLSASEEMLWRVTNLISQSIETGDFGENEVVLWLNNYFWKVGLQ